MNTVKILIELPEDIYSTITENEVGNTVYQAIKAGKLDPGWIPLSEKTPKVGEEVLVCYDFKGKRSVFIAEYYGEDGFIGYDDEYLTTEGRKCRKAIAWMPKPIPMPYTGE